MSLVNDSDISILRQELLNLDIADLDDAEYEIPPVEKTPTLESILNDDESSLISEDELTSYLSQELITGFEDSGETASVSSLGSRRDCNISGGSHSPACSQGASSHSPGGSILRHVILKAVSSQLRSAGDRVNAGKPTVMAVTTMVSVGTSHGFILMFDSTQTLSSDVIFRSNEDSVTAEDSIIRPEDSMTAEMRNVVVRLLAGGKYFCDQEQGAVSCLCLNVDCSRLLAGFSRGLILMLDTTDGRVLRTMNDVHTPSTAVLHVKFTDHPSLAVCSDSGGSVFELSFKRTLGIRSYDCKCLFSGSRGEVVTIEPLLLHQLSSHPLHGAVLVAMATLSKVIIVSIRPNTRLLLTHSVKASPASLPLLSWQFVIIQVADTSRVMDPVLAFARDCTIYFYQVSVESLGRIVCVSLQQLNLSYSLLSCHWLNARTLALLDTSEAFHLVDVRTREELESIDLSGIGLVYNSGHFKGLATGGNVSKALALAGERACYNTVQSFGNQMLFLGIRSFHVISIRTWAERVNHLLCQNRFPDALSLCMDFYEERGKAVLGLRGPRKLRQRLVKDKMVDILLVYVEATMDSSDSIFCHEAIPVIVNYCVQLDQRDILFGRLWDGVQSSNYGGRQTYLKSLENSILDGKITSLSPEIMQQLVSYLEKSGQWQSLEQCVLKVDVMCLDLEQVLILGKQHGLYNALISVWNRAMSDYISPIHELVPLLKEYLDSDGASSEKARSLGNQLLVYISCCLSGRGYPSGDIPIGNVETVRQQVFKSLCSQHSINAADAEDCYPYLRILLQFDTREFLNALAIAFEDPQFSTQLRQRLVNILILVMVEGEEFLSTQVGWLFTFLASQLSRSSYCSLRVEPKLFQRVVEFLTSPNQTTLHEERQDAFLELMSAGGLTNYSHQDLLGLARSAEFYQVCAVLHEKQGEHQQVLKCYLLDNYRKQQVFNYIQQSPYKEELQPGILENIDGLIEIDAVETGRMICRYFPQLMSEIILQLSDIQLYGFLQGACEEAELEPSLMTRYFSLMCRFNPEEVLHFVRSNNNIIVDEAVEISKQYGLDEVTAVFLERRGDYQEAFDLLLNKLQLAMNQGGPLENITHELVSLAQRGAAILDPRKSWLPLLQCLLKLNSHDLLKRVLHNTDLSLASELHLLLEHTNGTLGDLRSLIMGMFEKCRHEMAMLKSTSQLQYADIHCKLQQTVQELNKGISGPTVCTLCCKHFKTQLYLFRCGHGYHVGCMETAAHCTQCVKHDILS